MPLDTTQLLGTAAFDRSRKRSHAFLGRILELARTYNGMAPGDSRRRIEALDTIMLFAGEYLTSKRPSGGVKTTARWAALANLADQCYAEIQTLGAKMVSGPSDFGTIDNRHRSYWLERLDPRHRPGFVLSPRYHEWLNYGNGDFWTYIGGQGIGTVGQNDPHMPGSMKPALVKLFGPGEEARRLKYKASINGAGSLRDIWDEPKSTWDMHSAFGGEHWGIFVLSPEGDFYLNSHKVGRFHHSTFLGGAPVAAAGEIVVDFAGHIVVITNKTGHYMAGVDEMRRMVNLLPIPDDTLILPNLMDALRGPKVARFYRVGDFRAQGEAARPLSKFTVRLRIPPWAREGPNIRQIIDRVA